MNGVHDMGGMHGFGQVQIERDEPVFHERWEGIVRVMMVRNTGRYFNLDEFRHAIERMPSDEYLRASYYERWLHAVQTLLLEKGVITADELSTGQATGPAQPPKPEREPAPPINARFKPGDRVITRNIHPHGHTRLPRYARGRHGRIRKVYGPFRLPDANAHGDHQEWQPCYAVEFNARELWGEEAAENDRCCIDLWESYLEPQDT
jgi:nitrile hydratase subunit beta